MEEKVNQCEMSLNTWCRSSGALRHVKVCAVKINLSAIKNPPWPLHLRLCVGVLFIFPHPSLAKFHPSLSKCSPHHFVGSKIRAVLSHEKRFVIPRNLQNHVNFLETPALELSFPGESRRCLFAFWCPPHLCKLYHLLNRKQNPYS